MLRPVGDLGRRDGLTSVSYSLLLGLIAVAALAAWNALAGSVMTSVSATAEVMYTGQAVPGSNSPPDTPDDPVDENPEPRADDGIKNPNPPKDDGGPIIEPPVEEKPLPPDGRLLPKPVPKPVIPKPGLPYEKAPADVLSAEL